MIPQTKRNILFSILILLYPLLVFFGFKYFSNHKTTLVLAILLTVRIVFLKRTTAISKALNAAIIITLVTAAFGYFFNNYGYIKLYPVFVNTSLCLYFLQSLRARRTPIVETLARIKEKNLPPQGVRYTKVLTLAWSLFFLVNACISFYSFLYFSLENWTLYNGLLSYIFIGLFATVEFLIRVQLKRKWAKSE